MNGRIILKLNFKWMGVLEVDSSGSEQTQMIGSCEPGNELSDSLTFRKFRE